jgi:hypothetical protein
MVPSMPGNPNSFNKASGGVEKVLFTAISKFDTQQGLELLGKARMAYTKMVRPLIACSVNSLPNFLVCFLRVQPLTAFEAAKLKMSTSDFASEAAAEEEANAIAVLLAQAKSAAEFGMAMLDPDLRANNPAAFARLGEIMRIALVSGYYSSIQV